MQRLLTALLAGCGAHAAVLVATGSKGNPIDKVIELLTDLKAKIEDDGTSEQESYDKFACWCEESLGKKAEDITKGKKTIEELQQKVVKLKGECGSHSAEIEHLTKAVAENKAAQKEATEIREKEKEEYAAERKETEQCIAGLEAAINVLAGAGGGKKGFLETMQQAQLLSVAAGVRTALGHADKSMAADDIELVRTFVEKPTEFTPKKTLSAVGIKNPFGDYAPASTKIQGVLKGMYDAFTSDLEGANVAEATKQKSFEELMETKKEELKTLEESLRTHVKDDADKTKTVADSRTELDDTMKQLEADEDFFTNSKQSCRAKAGEWASRTRLRTQELATMTEALKIMEDPETKANFDKATESFLQVSSKSSGTGHSQQKQAFAKLKLLATETHNLAIARIAASVRSGGHFDKVIVTIDGLITTMREEEADDIKHRDRCEKDQGKNKNDMEDLQHSIDKTKKSITRMEGEGEALQEKMDTLETEIEATEKDLEDRLEMRNKEKEEFLKAVQADAKAVEALNAAIGVLSSFYSKNKLLLQLANVKVNSTATENQTIQVNKTGTVSGKANATVAVVTEHKTEQKKTVQKTEQKTQQKKGDPEYADAPPETTFSGGAKKGESGGIIDMLGMIVTDLEMETKTARQADIDAQNEYEKDRKAMNDMLLSQKDSLASMAKEHADLLVKIADYEEFKEQRKTDLDGEKEEEEALKADCDWIAEHFEDRRIARKKEMEGLVEAKNYLAGVDSGESLDFD
jgi:peptidoglycan hydrolase CwlO-like protein